MSPNLQLKCVFLAFYVCVGLNPLFCVLSYTTLLTFDFFGTIFLATCLPQCVLFKVQEIMLLTQWNIFFAPMYTDCDSLNMTEHPCSSTHKRNTMKDVSLEQGCKISPIRNTIVYMYIVAHILKFLN